MYGIVLLAATATGPTTPANHRPVVVVAAPVAAGCCGGYAAGCYGCYGAGCYGSAVTVGYRHRHSCHGCYGSCTGYSCFGSSCYGCWGSCSGYGYGYGFGCWGSSCYGSYSYGPGVGGCYGAYSYHYGCYGTVAPPAVVIPVEAAPVPPAAPGTAPAPKSGTGKDGASLRFQLPPNATLFVDGQKAAGDGAERAFYTPPLQAGQRYFYDVKAELVVNGQTVVEEKRVIVTAGMELVESFPRLQAAATDPATVAGR